MCTGRPGTLILTRDSAAFLIWGAGGHSPGLSRPGARDAKDYQSHEKKTSWIRREQKRDSFTPWSSVATLPETEQLYPLRGCENTLLGLLGSLWAQAGELCPVVPTVMIQGGQGLVQAEGGAVLPAAGSSPPQPACIHIPPDSAGRNPWGPQQQLLVWFNWHYHFTGLTEINRPIG